VFQLEPNLPVQTCKEFPRQDAFSQFEDFAYSETWDLARPARLRIFLTHALIMNPAESASLRRCTALRITTSCGWR